MFSYAKTQEELDNIKDALAAYFASNVDMAMDQLWEQGQWDNERNEAILKEDLHKHQ